LATQLVDANRLTRYQAKLLYQGHPSGLLLGDLELLDPIGQGGSGHVFLAKHRRLERTEAVKLLSAEHLNSPAAVARFEQEATGRSESAKASIT
jgi:serine/threonine protein kinase